jgi:hypothetical protein
MGEVVIADHTVTGTGVVLAQRFEQLAGAAGVSIQGAVYETLPKRLPFEYQSLGERDIKGFDETFRVYTVALKSGEIAPPPEFRSPYGRPNGRLAAAGILAVLVIVIGGLAWWQPWVSKVELPHWITWPTRFR